MKSVKKIVGLAIATTMMMGTVVFANPITEIEGLNKVDVEVSGTTTIPTISVTVPTSASFVINPYGVEVDGSQKQIISTDMEIINDSDIKMDVVLDAFKAEIAGKDNSTDKIVLASAPVLSTTTSVKKDVFVYLGVKGAEFDAKTSPKQIVKASATALNAKLGTMDAKDGENAKLVLAFDGSVNKNGVWNDADAIKVTPTFKFIPQMADAPEVQE